MRRARSARRLSVLWAAAAACACSASPQVPPPAQPSEIDLTRPASKPDPFAGITPCTEDEPASCGAARKQDADSESSTPAPSVSETVWNVPVSRNDPVLGPSDALVTLVVFSDFQCPFCKKAAPTLEALQRDHPRDVRLVWKDLPLPMHAYAQKAAEFARAVRAQRGDAGFWAAHDLLFDYQPDFDDDDLHKMARRIGGLDWDRIAADLRDKRHGATIYTDVRLADRLAVNLTPTTFVNGRKVIGARPSDVFAAVVADELASARDRVAAGTTRDRLYAQIIQNGKQVAPTSDAPAP